MSTKFEMSHEAKIILDLAKNSVPGTRLTFEMISNLTGINDIMRLRGLARTAFRAAFKRWQMRFASERGVGWIRLDETGKNQEVSGKIVRIHRTAKRASKLHQAVGYHGLDPLGKLTYATNGAQIAAIKKHSSRASRNKIATTAAESKSVEQIVGNSIERFKQARA